MEENNISYFLKNKFSIELYINTINKGYFSTISLEDWIVYSLYKEFLSKHPTNNNEQLKEMFYQTYSLDKSIIDSMFIKENLIELDNYALNYSAIV